MWLQPDGAESTRALTAEATAEVPARTLHISHTLHTCPLLPTAPGNAQLKLRLAGGASLREGRVEVWFNKTWRPIIDAPMECPWCPASAQCSDKNCSSPGFQVAAVVCRQLKYGGGAPRHSSFYGAASAAPWACR